MSLKNNKRKTGKRAWYPAVLTAAALTASIPCSIVSFGSSWPGADYDWEEGADIRSVVGDSIDYLSSFDLSSGPGSSISMAEEELPAELAVEQMTLSERYHDEYKVYEESLGGLFFFFSSVANGGITHEAVTLDIPANLTYTVQKDGLPWTWTQGQKISDYGTYVMKLTGVEDSSVPLSEQKEYKAVFRFRIQEKPPEPESAAEIAGSYLAEAAGALPTVRETEPAGQSDVRENTADQEEPETSAEPEAAEDAAPSGESEASEEVNPSESSEETETSEGDQKTEDTVWAEQKEPGIPRVQEYDRSSNQYLVTLENGSQLVSNIPEGYAGPMSVQITVAEEDAESVRAFCNDQEMEYVRGNSFMEPGQYRVEMGDCAFSFTIASAVGQMEYYPAPAGMRFVSCSLDGEEAELASDRYVSMKQDGVYQMMMVGEAGEELEVSLTKDTVAPQFTISKKGGTASIQYISEDIFDITLLKDGEKVENFAGYQVAEPGQYVLTVTDHAGNSTSYEFALSYQINTYGIAAVILLILLIAGGAVFVMHTKKNVTVR